MKIKRKDLIPEQQKEICNKYADCKHECPLREDFIQCTPLENTSHEFNETEIEVDL